MDEPTKGAKVTSEAGRFERSACPSLRFHRRLFSTLDFTYVFWTGGVEDFTHPGSDLACPFFITVGFGNSCESAFLTFFA